MLFTLIIHIDNSIQIWINVVQFLFTTDAPHFTKCNRSYRKFFGFMINEIEVVLMSHFRLIIYKSNCLPQLVASKPKHHHFHYAHLINCLSFVPQPEFFHYYGDIQSVK